MNTETLDKLYLEWSQFTSARTAREIAALRALRSIERYDFICTLLDAPEHTDDVRRSLMQQVHLLRWAIENPRP